MRPKTTDLDVILQVFLARDYDLDWCTPYKRHIEQICEQIRSVGNVPLIIDAGANIGASTVWFAVNFPDCQIYAIEPERQNFDVLRKNTAGYSNVALFQAALWDKPDRLSLTYGETTGWGCRVEEGLCDKPIVSAVTVPDLVGKDARLRLVIAKIDIEGAESVLFRSATEWVDDVPLIIFEQHDNLWHWLGAWQGTGHAVFSVLTRRKREYLSRGENVLAFLHPPPEDGQNAQSLHSAEHMSELPQGRGTEVPSAQ
jgi:FkbM family methyltransferase